MNEKDISEVIFLEVKSGKSRNFNSQERKLRDVIRSGNVKWAEFYADTEK
jgi:predicted Holliday junction resolvase-like endonuclease